MEEKSDAEIKNFVDRKITELGAELQNMGDMAKPNETDFWTFSSGKQQISQNNFKKFGMESLGGIISRLSTIDPEIREWADIASGP